jgi:hypothetical protein
MCLLFTRKSETELQFSISGMLFNPCFLLFVNFRKIHCEQDSNLPFISPYMSADMRRMAEAFNTSVTALEDELMQLILDGQIQARIDSHNKVNQLNFFAQL